MKFRKEGKYYRHQDRRLGWEGWFRGMLGIGILLILLSVYIHFRGSSRGLVILAYGLDFFISGGLLILLYNGTFKKTREFNFFLVSLIGLSVYYVERFSNDLSETVERTVLFISLLVCFSSYLTYVIRLHVTSWRKWARFMVVLLMLLGFVSVNYLQDPKFFFYIVSMAACILGY